MNKTNLETLTRCTKKIKNYVYTNQCFWMSLTTNNLFFVFFFFRLLIRKTISVRIRSSVIFRSAFFFSMPNYVINHRCVMVMTHDRRKKQNSRSATVLKPVDYELLIGFIVITRKVPGMSKNSGKMNTNYGFQRVYDGKIWWRDKV